MRRLVAPLALTGLLLVAAACSKTPTNNAAATPTPKASATSSPSASPRPVPTGSPCQIAQASIDKIKPLQDKYKVAFGSNDAAKANAAKAEIQAGLQGIAADLRVASAAATGNEADLKEALLTAATKIEAGAQDATLFAVKKTQTEANTAFTAAALSWVPMTLLAECNQPK
jgi:hypothetical protein